MTTIAWVWLAAFGGFLWLVGGGIWIWTGGIAEPGSGSTAEVLREHECRVLKETVGRRIQDTPQRVDEVQTYEWCQRGEALSLVQRTFWRIDGKTTRNEGMDTPASHGKVLWERGVNDVGGG